jgi:hypothetical protein
MMSRHSILFNNIPAPRQAGGNLAIAASRYQRGTALIMSMVILLILTLLGITAMGTASLEEKMSGNTQEITRAFEAAESGLIEWANTPGSLDLNTQKTSPKLNYGTNSSATVVNDFRDFSPPKRGSGYGSNFEAANFEQVSTGTTAVGAKAVIHQGLAQIVPKAN